MRTILHAEDDETIAQLVEIAIEKTPGVYVLVRRDNGALALVIPFSHRGLNGERPAGRVAQLGRISGKTLELVVGEP